MYAMSMYFPPMFLPINQNSFTVWLVWAILTHNSSQLLAMDQAFPVLPQEVKAPPPHSRPTVRPACPLHAGFLPLLLHQTSGMKYHHHEGLEQVPVLAGPREPRRAGSKRQAHLHHLRSRRKQQGAGGQWLHRLRAPAEVDQLRAVLRAAEEGENSRTGRTVARCRL